MNIQDIRNTLEDKLLDNLLDLGSKTYKNSANQKLYKEFILKYPYFKNINEIIYLLKNKNNLENLHIFCPVCGKKNRFLNFTLGYRKYCSRKCYHDISFNDYIKIHPEFLDKIKCHNCDKEFKPTKNEIMHWLRREKHNKCLYITCSKHCTLVLTQKKIDKELVKQRRRQTLLTKTGNPNYRNLEKARQTLYKNSGVYHNSQLPNFSEKVKNTKFIKYGDPNYNNIDKAKNTFKIRYGVQWNSQRQEWKEVVRNKKDIIMQKSYETYKRNNSFKSVSKPELKTFRKLIKKFPDTIHTYRDSIRYPFKCDFYIPSKDLFIECHYGLFHQKEPFNKNNIQHLQKLEKLIKLDKEKSVNKINNRYKGIIYCWTILDPKKLETFKKNNLNYKIFYTEKEFDDWFQTL